MMRALLGGGLITAFCKYMLHLLESIKTDPERIIGTPSVFGLEAFRYGYYTLLGQIDQKTPESIKFWNEFIDGFEAKYGVTNMDAASIMFLLSGSESEAIRLYIAELESYLKNHEYPAEKKSAAVNQDKLVSLGEQLNYIRTKPGMYLTPIALTTLYSWISGFEAAAAYHISTAYVCQPDLKAFEQWLRAKEEVTLRCRWDHLLIWVAGFDQRRALDLFFDQIFKFSAGQNDI